MTRKLGVDTMVMYHALRTLQIQYYLTGKLGVDTMVTYYALRTLQKLNKYNIT